jgi:hypothetical protein
MRMQMVTFIRFSLDGLQSLTTKKTIIKGLVLDLVVDLIRIK